MNFAGSVHSEVEHRLGWPQRRLSAGVFWGLGHARPGQTLGLRRVTLGRGREAVSGQSQVHGVTEDHGAEQKHDRVGGANCTAARYIPSSEPGLGAAK